VRLLGLLNMRPITGCPLWIGHIGDVGDLRALHSTGILAVIDLVLNETPASLPRELVYCRFPLIDGVGNPAWLLQAAVDCAANLLHSGTPTLVFCGAGMSRSPCIAAAALARVHGCSPDEALTLVARSGAVDVMPGLWKEVKATHLPRQV
jgi:protein-tyrosine phosphatase